MSGRVFHIANYNPLSRSVGVAYNNCFRWDLIRVSMHDAYDTYMYDELDWTHESNCLRDHFTCKRYWSRGFSPFGNNPQLPTGCVYVQGIWEYAYASSALLGIKPCGWLVPSNFLAISSKFKQLHLQIDMSTTTEKTLSYGKPACRLITPVTLCSSWYSVINISAPRQFWAQSFKTHSRMYDLRYAPYPPILFRQTDQTSLLC